MPVCPPDQNLREGPWRVTTNFQRFGFNTGVFWANESCLFHRREGCKG